VPVLPRLTALLDATIGGGSLLTLEPTAVVVQHLLKRLKVTLRILDPEHSRP
jgi:hypothetical protein